jgi:hypothetical protein
VNEAKKRYTPYVIDKNICGVVRVIMDMNSLSIEHGLVTTLYLEVRLITNSKPRLRFARQGGPVAGTFQRK